MNSSWLASWPNKSKCSSVRVSSNAHHPFKDVLLDIHLYDHVDSLYEQIHSKALIQYFSPYVRVDLVQMAVAFNFQVMGASIVS